MNEPRGNLYLLTGLILGLGLGLLFAWVISPVKYVDTQPSTLTGGQKDTYRQVIALAYQSSGDLGRARLRINLVDPNSSYQVLAAQAQRLLAENSASEGARALAQLAADLNAAQQATAVAGASSGEISPGEAGSDPVNETVMPAPTAESLATATPPQVAAIQTATPLPTLPPTNTSTPQPTFTPRPTSTPVRVIDAPFILKSQEAVCGPDGSAGLLQINVIDQNGDPIPGVPVMITWQNGEEIFYTGLVPEVDPGYADYSMLPDVIYRLKVGEASEVIEEISIPDCGGGWKIKFDVARP